MTVSITPSSLSLTPAELHRTFDAMRSHGGGFVQALAVAWFKADPVNRGRIQMAFPHLIESFGPSSIYYSASTKND